MADNNIFSYTRRDYEGSRQEGLSKIPTLSKGAWTDLNATDPGIIILDYVHALVDMISYYQDHQALETFITTAKERANIFRLAKQLSYNIRSAKGATCEVEFTSIMPYTYTIKIPKYTSISTLSGIHYLTTEDAYLETGEYKVLVPCVQGTRNEITYQGTGVSRYSNVVGAKNQSLRLVDNNIDIDSIIVTDNIGRVWTPVDYIIFSTEIDRVYQVELNPDNTITIKFGDGDRGVLPKETDMFTISYISTLAEAGRVSEHTIRVLNEFIVDTSGRVIEFSVDNPTASSGGSSVPTSQEIRELAPGVIKAQDRAVTLNDFENLAKSVEGVSDAKAYDINIDPSIPHHEVRLVIVPNDPDGATTILKNNVHNYLSKRMIPPTSLRVATPTYNYIDIEITVKKIENKSAGELSYEIQETIQKYFRDRVSNLGEPFYPSDIISIVSNLDNVRSIVSITPNNVVTVSNTESVRLGELVINIQ